MNDYQRLRDALKVCDKVPECICSENSRIACACHIVRNWVKGDKDKLLELKAQARVVDVRVLENSLLSTANMGITMFGIYFAVAVGIYVNSEEKVGWLVLIILLFILLLIIYLYVSLARCYYDKLAIWNEYMNIAIEEVEKEFDNQKR